MILNGAAKTHIIPLALRAVGKIPTRHFASGASLLSSGDTQVSSEMSSGISHSTVGGSIREQPGFLALRLGALFASAPLGVWITAMRGRRK